MVLNCNFTYSLLGIETVAIDITSFAANVLQFHLLPIRDWNASKELSNQLFGKYCNFTYSLLGIETYPYVNYYNNKINCNFTYSLLGIETPTN